MPQSHVMRIPPVRREWGVQRWLLGREGLSSRMFLGSHLGTDSAEQRPRLPSPGLRKKPSVEQRLSTPSCSYRIVWGERKGGKQGSCSRKIKAGSRQSPSANVKKLKLEIKANSLCVFSSSRFLPCAIPIAFPTAPQSFLLPPNRPFGSQLPFFVADPFFFFFKYSSINK